MANESKPFLIDSIVVKPVQGMVKREKREFTMAEVQCITLSWFFRFSKNAMEWASLSGFVKDALQTNTAEVLVCAGFKVEGYE